MINANALIIIGYEMTIPNGQRIIRLKANYVMSNVIIVTFKPRFYDVEIIHIEVGNGYKFSFDFID